MSTKKPKKYYNPKEKDKDYSIMSWKKSFNDTKSSISSIEFADEKKPIAQRTKKSSTLVEVSEDSENDLKDIDNSKDGFPKIELEVNEILEKSREKRNRKRLQKQTCYSQVGGNSRGTSKVVQISDHYDSQSDDNENDSSLMDTEISVDDSQNEDSDLQRKLKYGAIKGKTVVNKNKNRNKNKKNEKGVKSKLEQENIVSSSTGENDIQLRTRSKTLKITSSKSSDSSKPSRTNTAKPTENDVKAMLRPKISRKLGNKKLPVICEDDVDDFENEVGVSNKHDKMSEEVERGARNRRSSRGNKRLPEKDKSLAATDDVLEGDAEHWTVDEKHRLYQ